MRESLPKKQSESAVSVHHAEQCKLDCKPGILGAPPWQWGTEGSGHPSNERQATMEGLGRHWEPKKKGYEKRLLWD